MIATLTGIVTGVSGESCILEVSGVGFQVFMPLTNLETLSRTTEPVKIHTHFHLREDGVSLYGFIAQDDKVVFEKVIGVSGIGPKTALAILAALSGEQLREAIYQEDHRVLTAVSGVGLKTAQRLILELKGKLGKGTGVSGGSVRGSGLAGSTVGDAVDALISLGYPPKEAAAAVDALMGEESGLTTPELVRKALQQLGKKK